MVLFFVQWAIIVSYLDSTGYEGALPDKSGGCWLMFLKEILLRTLYLSTGQEDSQSGYKLWFDPLLNGLRRDPRYSELLKEGPPAGMDCRFRSSAANIFWGTDGGLLVPKEDEVVALEFFDVTLRSQAEDPVYELIDILISHIPGGSPKPGRVQIDAFLGLGHHEFLTLSKVQEETGFELTLII